jgi:hypothetical protein
MSEITLFIILGMCAAGSAVVSLILLSLHIDLFFLRFKLENHPVLVNMIENAISVICEEEGIKTFYKTCEQINPKGTKEEDIALGMYIYTLDDEHKQKSKKALIEIEKLEKDYNKSYSEICKLVGVDNSIEKEDFMYPRIVLCHEKLIAFGLKSYYSTYFHELGHHFAIKESGGVTTETDADIQARNLIFERLPYFFQLIPYFRFEYRLKLKEMSFNEKMNAYIGYLSYYLKYKKTIKRESKKICNK